MKIKIYHNPDGTIRITKHTISNLEQVIYSDLKPGETAEIEIDATVSYNARKSEKITTK